jgi:hemerythrin-like domain-containing protein
MAIEIKPIKRSQQLAPLSREHHEGLLMVWKIRQGLKYNVPNSDIYAYVQWFWKEELQEHLKREENFLIKDLPKEDPMVQQMLKDHADIRMKMDIPEKEVDNDFLSALATQMEKHIRFEERELFPYIEKLLSSEMLDKVMVNLNNKRACSSQWLNEFWLIKK